MTNQLIALVAVAFVTASGTAQLRIFLAAVGASESEALLEDPALENPQAGSTERLYLYAQMFDGPEAWNGISLDIEVRGGGTIANWQFYNYVNDTFVRWDYVGPGTLDADGTLLTDAFGLAFLTGFGVQNDPACDDLDLHHRPDANATLLGWIKIVMPSAVSETEVFLGVGGFGITKAGTSVPQDIYLGFGDEDDGLTGDSVHQFSSVADATVTNDCAGFLRGDANCDDAVTGFDIDPFILALTDPAGYETQHPECHRLCTCDTNSDGELNAFDIDSFIECVTAGTCP